jgi:hypothetical protein
MAKKVKVSIEKTIIFNIDGQMTDDQAIAIAAARLRDGMPFDIESQKEEIREYSVIE